MRSIPFSVAIASFFIVSASAIADPASTNLASAAPASTSPAPISPASTSPAPINPIATGPDLMAGYYGNTAISTGGMAEVHIQYNADHTFVMNVPAFSLRFKGTWAMNGANLCFTYDVTPPGVTKPRLRSGRGAQGGRYVDGESRRRPAHADAGGGDAVKLHGSLARSLRSAAHARIGCWRAMTSSTAGDRIRSRRAGRRLRSAVRRAAARTGAE